MSKKRKKAPKSTSQPSAPPEPRGLADEGHSGIDSEEQQAEDEKSHAYQHLGTGARLLRSYRFAEALPPLVRANEILPDDEDILITLGGAYVMNGQWSKAVSLLEHAVEQYPENARLWLNLAAAYLGRLELSSQSRQEQAIQAYIRAIENDPQALSAHYNVGLIYAQRQAWVEAESWFQQALLANPSDKDAAYWLTKVRNAQQADQEE